MFYLYKYLFFRIYSGFRKKLYKNYSSLHTSLTSILVITFLITLDLYYIAYHLDALGVWRTPKYFHLVIFAIVCTINTILFIVVTNYRKIEIEFSKETRRARIVSIIFTLLFILLSFLPLFI